MKRRIIDKRRKEKFLMDDEYLNGQARICGWQASLVYMSLCRHANKEQESFPSIKLMSEELSISRPTVIKGLKNLERFNVIQIKKTRTKDGRWLNNTYILTDRSEWIKSQVNDVDLAAKSTRVKSQVNDVDSVQVNDVDTKETHITRKHIEGNTYNIAKQGFAGNEINELMALFKSVNPSYERLFSNKTQRAALQRLVKKWGYEKVEAMIKYLPKIFGKPYAPTITTPHQLESKLANLISYIKQNRDNSNLIKL